MRYTYTYTCTVNEGVKILAYRVYIINYQEYHGYRLAAQIYKKKNIGVKKLTSYKLPSIIFCTQAGILTLNESVTLNGIRNLIMYFRGERN